MSKNKYISYLLCNNGILVNLYKLYFLFSYFFFLQLNKRVFYIFVFPTSYFFTSTTKHKLGKTKFFLPSYFFTPLTL